MCKLLFENTIRKLFEKWNDYSLLLILIIIRLCGMLLIDIPAHLQEINMNMYFFLLNPRVF